MNPLRILSPTEQVARHLERQIGEGLLAGDLPGMKALSLELGVNHKTMDSAVRILEHKGLVQSNGIGKKRTIRPVSRTIERTLRINILLGDQEDAKQHYMIEIRDRLIQEGHSAGFAPKCLSELKMDLPRVRSMVAKHPADAWIVQAASREVLEWFCGQDTPSFALFGRFRNVAIAGTGTTKEVAVIHAVRKLHQLGHRRMVMMAQEEQCQPDPGPIPRAFLETLGELGITCGRYNLPLWHSDSESFRQCLDSLFRHTPPTALFISGAALFIAAQQHLALKGIVAPKHVSMVCHDPSASFRFCHPEISHISFDLRPCVQRITQWAQNVKKGKPDDRQVLSASEFIAGGTIGPSPP